MPSGYDLKKYIPIRRHCRYFLFCQKSQASRGENIAQCLSRLFQGKSQVMLIVILCLKLPL
ncbi:MAG: hypothetical protein ACR2NY_01355 [Alphaproteobacteria bacterium]